MIVASLAFAGAQDEIYELYTEKERLEEELLDCYEELESLQV